MRLVLCVVLALLVDRAFAEKPNIILILADDLGWGDVWSERPRELQTPFLDSLARSGSRFTAFYSVSPVCSPSRAALLTGLFPPRTGIERVLRPGSRKGLAGGFVTLAEALREQGYTTAVIGKWHLGDAPAFLPTQHGFGEFFGIPYSNDMLPLRLLRNGEIVDPSPTQPLLSERFTQEALSFLSRNARGPFFLFWSLKIPHVPLALPAGWRSRGRSAYLDSVEYLDWNVGRVLRRLEELELVRRTLVIFTSDNGSWRHASNGGLRAGKKTVYEGGVRVPLVVSYPGRVAENREVKSPAMMCDLFPTILLLAGAPEPEDLDGLHLLDALGVEDIEAGPGREPESPIFFFLKGRVGAVRSGRWKLHARPAAPTPNAPDELFDLVTDPGETKNLIFERPEVAVRLRQLVIDFEKSFAR